MPTALRPLLLLIACAAIAPVQAQDPGPGPGPGAGPVGREDAGARVRQVERDGGRVLQAEPMQRGGREVYRLKVLTPEGRVRVLSDHGGAGREPPREAQFQLRERDGPRSDTLIRDRPRTRAADAPPVESTPRPPRRDEEPRERNRY